MPSVSEETIRHFLDECIEKSSMAATAYKVSRQYAASGDIEMYDCMANEAAVFANMAMFMRIALVEYREAVNAWKR
jgi:hypothetical protein